MGLIIPDDSQIRPEELTLDYYLEAIPIFDGRNRNPNVTGRESYTIKAFSESRGFGITSIELDLKPNTQPLVIINFKDLYGNLLFNRNLETNASNLSDDDFRFDILFQLPYPKFRLYIKGYLGKQVNFLLQLKSVKTTFQPTDGSFEIKTEYVPNIFGFFNDIPYQFLFAVPELKNKLGDKSPVEDNQSIIEIAKIGQQVTTTIRQIEDRYASTNQKILALDGDVKLIADNYNNGKISFEKISGDDDLNAGGFTTMVFNISLGNFTIPNDDNSKTIFGSAILASINNPQKIEYKNANSVNEIKNIIESDAGKNQIQANKSLIKKNLDVITTVSASKGYKQFTDRKIDTQTIYNVMTRLAGDSSYILGYILETGLRAYNANAQQRIDDKNLIGLMYPLVEERKIGEDKAFGEQVPWDGAKIERERVELFVDALMTGRQVAQEVREEVEEANAPPDQPIDASSTSQLQKKISNLEFSRNSPYVGEANNIIVNMIQRSGILSSGYASDVYKDSNNKAYQIYIDDEFTNFENEVTQLQGTKLQTLKKFCTNIKNNFDASGNFKSGKSFNSTVEGGSTLKNYLAEYFKKFPEAINKKQFKSNDPSTLQSVWTINNGILYYNQLALNDAVKAKNPNANNILGSRQILVFVEQDDFPKKDGTPYEVSKQLREELSGTYTADTKMLSEPNKTNKTSNIYFSWYFFRNYGNNTGNIIQKLDSSGQPLIDTKTKENIPKLPSKPEESIFIDYQKLFFEAQKKIFSPNDLIIQKIESSDQNQNNALKEGAFFRLIDTTVTAPKDWVINLQDQTNRSYLYGLCNKTLEAILKKEEEDRKNASSGGGGGIGGGGSSFNELSEKDKASIKAETVRSVYVQFHHICQAWITLANVDNPFDSVLPQGTNFELRNKLENIYRSNNKKSNFYLNFTFPVIDENSGIDVSAAIINSDPLLEDNTQTSTLNMMQNICSQNNFLLQPIPGGVTDNLDEIFMPSKSTDDSLYRNALSIIWSPTPENRYANNKNIPIYPEKDFIKMPALTNSEKPIPCLQYGSPNNIVLKSVKAGTDDNKVTAESIAATSDIVGPQNSYRRKGFDCSMLSIMQGRSYKISLDLLGNAQIFPTMHIVLDGIPIFTGLYWVTEVQHKITPNNFETTLEAVKMKYVGGKGENSYGKFAIIPPVTKNTLSSFVNKGILPVGSSGGVGQNICNSGVLNFEFCTKIQNNKIKSAGDLGPIIKEFTKNAYSDFVVWFNSEVYQKCPLAKTQINKDNFDNVWNETFISSLWDKYGLDGISFLEFVNLHSIIYMQVGGQYKSVREKMNDVTAKDNPGVAYAFDTIGNKISYNGGFNSLASDLFINNNFIEAHSSKKFGDDIPIRSLNEWSQNKPGKFPVSAFANVQDAVATTPTFMNEADFYKFSGRGLIPTRWRTAYTLLVEYVLKYSGTDSKITNYKNTWSQSPFDGDINKILDRSSNSDWDDLFDNSVEMQVVALAFFWKNGSKIKDSQYMTLSPTIKLDKKILERETTNIAKSILDKREFVESHITNVYTILDKLYPEGMPKPEKIDDSVQKISINEFAGRKNNVDKNIAANVWLNQILRDDWTINGINIQSLTGKLSVGKGGGRTVNDNEYKKYKTSPNVAWQIYDIGRQQMIAESGNAGKGFYAASTSKAVTVAAAYANNNGIINSKEDIKKATKLLIYSDNNVWDRLTNLAGGKGRVNEFAKTMGYNMKPQRREGNNINAIAMNQFWNDVARNNFEGAESVFKITALCQTNGSRARKYIPSNVYVGSKTGSYEEVNHDSGWFYDGKNWYAITVLTTLNQNGGGEPCAIVFGGLFNEYVTNG